MEERRKQEWAEILTHGADLTDPRDPVVDIQRKDCSSQLLHYGPNVWSVHTNEQGFRDVIINYYQPSSLTQQKVILFHFWWPKLWCPGVGRTILRAVSLGRHLIPLLKLWWLQTYAAAKPYSLDFLSVCLAPTSLPTFSIFCLFYIHFNVGEITQWIKVLTTKAWRQGFSLPRAHQSARTSSMGIPHPCRLPGSKSQRWDLQTFTSQVAWSPWQQKEFISNKVEIWGLMFKDYPLNYLPVYTHIYTYTQREREAGRKTDRQTDTEKQRQTETKVKF